MSNTIITGVIVIISLLVGFFLNVLYENYREKRQRQNKGLKNHFKGLVNNVIEPMKARFETIFNDHGELLVTMKDSGGKLYDASVIDASWPEFEHGDELAFKLHFPKQTETINSVINEASTRNKELKIFEDKLKRLIEKKSGFTFKGQKPPTITEGVPKWLRKELCEILEDQLLTERSMEEGASIPHDFDIFDVKQNENGLLNIYAHGRTWAQVKTEEEKDKFIQVMSELMNSDKLLEQMRLLFEKAYRLEEKLGSMARTLDEILTQHNYGKLLTRKRSCPICQVIF